MIRTEQLERVGDLLTLRAKLEPRRVALRDLLGRTMTFEDLDRQAKEVATQLNEIGDGDPGCVIAMMPNCIDAVIAVFSVLKSHHHLMMVHNDFPQRAMFEVERSLQPVALIEVGGQLPNGKAPAYWESLRIRNYKRRSTTNFRDRSALSTSRPLAISSFSTALKILTSGSTGRPKAIVCSNEQVLWVVKCISERLEYRQTDLVACISPLAFDYGLYQLFLAIQAGSSILIDPRLTQAHEVIAAIQRHAITVLPFVPPFLRAILMSPMLGRADTDSVRLITTTGDILYESDIQAAGSRFRRAHFVPMYGLSECKRVAISPIGMKRPPEAIGFPLSGTSVAVVDSDGTPIAPGQPGQLVVAGSHLAYGYERDVASTRRRFTIDPKSGLRLLWTGDVLDRDESGWLYWVGRREGMIKNSAFRVESAEIERVIARLPSVAEVGVFGVSDPTQGEIPTAVVRFVDGVDVTTSTLEVERQLKASLPAWSMPRVEVKDEPLPRTRNGKVDRAGFRRAHEGIHSTPQHPSAESPRAALRRRVTLLAEPERRKLPAARRFIACHSQAFLSAFKLPFDVSPEEFELLTSVPFGIRHIPGDPNRVLIPHLDPDLGLERAATALGLEVQFSSEASIDAGPQAIERLDNWLNTGPVVLGPIDLGELTYHPTAAPLAGCDHYVVALGRATDKRLILRDPEGFIQVAVSEDVLVRAWAKERVPEGRGPFAMRRLRVALDTVPPSGTTLRAQVVKHAIGNLREAMTSRNGGSRAWRAIEGEQHSPSVRRALTFLIPATSYRVYLAARFFSTLAQHKGVTRVVRSLSQQVAELLDGEVAALARLQYLVMHDEPDLAKILGNLSALERSLEQATEGLVSNGS